MTQLGRCRLGFCDPEAWTIDWERRMRADALPGSRSRCSKASND